MADGTGVAAGSGGHCWVDALDCEVARKVEPGDVVAAGAREIEH